MYEEFYGLKEKPFNLTPDPRFLFLSSEHRNALELLLYGIKRREGFALLTGGVGTGKTILCRALVERLDPGTKVALILNPMLSEEELLKAILQDFGLDHARDTKKELIDELNSFLLKQASIGGTTVLILDEAQNLSIPVLEQVRILSNLETEKEKLIQIILVGQEELKRNLELPRLRQLDQRISVRYHLGTLAKSEIRRYIEHRLTVAGSNSEARFLKSAINAIYRHSSGIPRIVNLVCDRSLLAGYVRQTYSIGGGLVRKAVSELRMDEGISRQRLVSTRIYRLILISIFLILLLIVFWAIGVNKATPKHTLGRSDNGSSASPDSRMDEADTDGVVRGSIAISGENTQSSPVEGYTVHVSSHKDRDEAERTMQALQSQGYNLYIETAETPTGSWHRVVSECFPDLSRSVEMVKALAQINIHAGITHRSEGTKPEFVELYRVSLGLYKSSDNAENLTGRLRDQGHSAYVCKLENGLYEVFVGPYAAREDCGSVIETLQSSEIDFPTTIRNW